jgi:hypothetical protein
MSGPTGIQGFQGTGGFLGHTGFTGYAGANGPQGNVGAMGFTGPTGILGGTGTQLYSNGTLVQAGNSADTFSASASSSVVSIFSFSPALNINSSTTISGRYDATNFYGTPLDFVGTVAFIPAGTYYITASMPVYRSAADDEYYYLTFQEGATVLATGTYGNRNGTSYLQYLYTPPVDTEVTFYVNCSGGSSDISVGGTTVNVSIVKIW